VAATRDARSGGWHRRLLGGEVGDGDGFVAVRAGPADPDASAEQLAVGAASLVEVAGLALGTLVDDA
jgi:hypothetical protein